MGIKCGRDSSSSPLDQTFTQSRRSVNFLKKKTPSVMFLPPDCSLCESFGGSRHNNDNRFHSLRFLKTCPWVSGLRKCNQSYKRSIGAKAWRSQAKVYKMGTKWRWRGTGQTGQLQRSGSTKMTSAFRGRHLTSQAGAHKNNFQCNFNAV